ncbi:MAG: hypothetical protein ACR2IE_12030 [Candidatus Sumerlaeaceae bacterium]
MKVTLERGEILDVALIDNDRIIGTLSLQLRGLSVGARFSGASAPAAAADNAGKRNGRRRKRGPLSPEARARMADAQRRRRDKEKGPGEKSAS